MATPAMSSAPVSYLSSWGFRTGSGWNFSWDHWPTNQTDTPSLPTYTLSFLSLKPDQRITPQFSSLTTYFWNMFMEATCLPFKLWQRETHVCASQARNRLDGYRNGGHSGLGLMEQTQSTREGENFPTTTSLLGTYFPAMFLN
jgi:hypothetical protein